MAGEHDATARFTGFPPEAVAFYEGLVADNTKAFWNDHKGDYERAVRGPMLALTTELEPEVGPFHLFRPYRDVRFSKDKSPYKDHQGAVTEGEGGELYYLHLGTDGLFVASGYHTMAADQLDRFRRAVDDDAAGEELVAIVASLERRYEIGGQALSTAPRGYPRDHPRVRFLRHKGITAGRRLGTPAWLATRQAKRRILDTWLGAAPLCDWLNAHVGPSALPPPEGR
jgi:uncharacterized protein (TIGR02453 family)